MRTSGALLVMCTMLFATSVSAQLWYCPLKAESQIQITAQGYSQAAPDVAQIEFSLSAGGQSAVEAWHAMHQLLQKLLAELAPHGVSSQLVKERNLTISNNQMSVPVGSSHMPTVSGYKAFATYAISLPFSEDKADSLLRIAQVLHTYELRTRADKKDNEESPVPVSDVQIQLSLKDRELLRQKAVEDAVSKVRKLAVSAARQLGKKEVELVHLDVKDLPSYTAPAKGSISFGPVQAAVRVTATFRAK